MLHGQKKSGQGQYQEPRTKKCYVVPIERLKNERPSSLIRSVAASGLFVAQRLVLSSRSGPGAAKGSGKFTGAVAAGAASDF